MHSSCTPCDLDSGERTLQKGLNPERRQQADSRLSLVNNDLIAVSQVELLAAIGSFSVVVYLAISGLLEIMIMITAFGKQVP